MNNKRKFYTHDEAANIVELFEDILAENNVHIPSPEDDEREPDNMIGLYGSVYSNLLDSVEEHLIETINAVLNGNEVVPFKFSGNA